MNYDMVMFHLNMALNGFPNYLFLLKMKTSGDFQVYPNSDSGLSKSRLQS